MKLKAKVALQQAGVIALPVAAPTARPEGKADDHGGGSNGTPAPAASAAAHQATANLARDARAARNTQATVIKDGKSPADRVLHEPETRVSDEGTNLIKDTRAE